MGITSAPAISLEATTETRRARFGTEGAALATVLSSARRVAADPRTALVTAAFLLANVVGQFITGMRIPADFTVFFYAARLLANGSHSLYITAYGFMNPPLAAWILEPLTRLPLGVSTGIFLGISMVAMGIGSWLLVRRLHCPAVPTLLAALSLPAVLTIKQGQWDALLFLALVAALVLLERWPVLAGALISVLVVKAQVVWLVPVVLVALQRWRALLGVAIGAAVFVGSDVLLLGSHWLDWPRATFLTGAEHFTWSFGLPSIPAYLWGSGAALLTSALLGIAAVMGIFRVRRRLRDDPTLAIAAAVCLSLLLGMHSFPYDLLVAAPALALTARRMPLLSAAAAAGLSAAYLIGALPSFLFSLDAYIPAMAATTVLVVVVLVGEPAVSPSGLLHASR